MAEEITDNSEESRFELREDGELVGYLEYRPAGASRIIAHTEVFEGNEGKGLGGKLVEHALQAFEAEGKEPLIVCPFAKAYVDRLRQT